METVDIVGTGTRRGDHDGPMLGELVWWAAICMLALYGIFFIYSTGYIGESYPVRTTWIRHTVWCAAGLAAAFGMARLAPRGLAMKWLTWGGYALSLAGVAAVLLLGTKIGGARRWLVLGPMMLQPAEFARLFTLLAVCDLLAADGGSKSRLWRRLLLVPVVGVPFGLILIEPSYGNACSLLPPVLAAVAIRSLWRAVWSLLLVAVVAALVGGGVLLLKIRSGEVMPSVQLDSVGGGAFRQYHLKRLASYLTPSGGWNEQQSVMTVASGGLTGKGYLNGTMKSLGYLPRTVAPTDFIFSVIGEEMGFAFGTLPVFLAYAALVFLGLHWAGRSPDLVGTLDGVSLTVLVATHVLVNIGMVVRLVPVIGLPLPLLSYGGSFTLAMGMALGSIWGIGRRIRLQPHETVPESVAENEFCINVWGLLKIKVHAGRQSAS